MADIPVAQVVPMQDNDNLPIAREYVPPFPVSMFDLVPGRRYRISNREITPIRRRQHYPEGQHIFEAVFICLTTAIRPLAQTHYAKFSPINFFDKLEDAGRMAGISSLDGLQGMLGGENVYPIFSYEQGLTLHQLEDLTLALDIMSAANSPNLQREDLTWNRPIAEPLPGLLYYGHDTHSGHGGALRAADGFIDRNFRYLLFKLFVEENEKISRGVPSGDTKVQLARRFNRGNSGTAMYPNGAKFWWQQPPYEGKRHPQTGNPSQLQPGIPSQARDLGDECFTDLYFNDRLNMLANNNTWRGLIGNPPLTRLQNHILKNTRPMIIFPSNWSIIDSHYWNPPPAVTGVVRPAIERGRRRLDGGRRIKTKKKRKKQKTKRRKRRRKMRVRAK